jgi:hypothetical protein
MGLEDNKQKVNREDTFQVGIWEISCDTNGVYSIYLAHCNDH